MVLGLVVALAAMVLNSAAGLLESDATRHGTPRRSLLTQPRYLAGLAIDGLGWACTVVALRYLPVFVVQAVLGGAIALTAVGARIVYGSTLRGIDRLACGACVVGLVLVAASAGRERPGAPSWTAMLVLAVAAGVLVGWLVASWTSARTWPPALIAGLGFGGSSVAVRAVHLGVGQDPLALLTTPPVYLLAVAGVVVLAGSPVHHPPPRST